MLDGPAKYGRPDHQCSQHKQTKKELLETINWFYPLGGVPYLQASSYYVCAFSATMASLGPIMAAAVAGFHTNVSNLVHVNTAAFGLQQYRSLALQYLPAWLLVSSTTHPTVLSLLHLLLLLHSSLHVHDCCQFSLATQNRPRFMTSFSLKQMVRSFTPCHSNSMAR